MQLRPNIRRVLAVVGPPLVLALGLAASAFWRGHFGGGGVSPFATCETCGGVGATGGTGGTGGIIVPTCNHANASCGWGDPGAPSGCTAPANGTTTCAGSVGSTQSTCLVSCQSTCNAGYCLSGSTCVALAPTSCGASGGACNDCTVTEPPNSVASCTSAGACQYVSCNSGYHPCGSSGGCTNVDGSTCFCTALSSASCGDTCLSCTAPTNGSSGCSDLNGNGAGGACTFSCSSGYWLSSQATTSAGCTSQSFVTTF